MFEQAKLQGTQIGPNGPPRMQKERLKSPQKSPILENQAIWVILAILASHFQTRMDAPKKSTTWNPAYINETEPHAGFA